MHTSSNESLKGDGDTILSEFRGNNPPTSLGIVGVRSRGGTLNFLEFRDAIGKKKLMQET